MKLYLATLFTAVFCGGCIPYPHTSIRFPQVDGRVVDADTQNPVVGATVAIHDQPQSYVKTDSQGLYHFPRQKNFHIGYDLNFVCGPGDIPTGKQYMWTLDVTASGYVTNQIEVLSYYTSYKTNEGSYTSFVLKDTRLVKQ